MKTIFIDIDGVILEQEKGLSSAITREFLWPLEGVKAKLDEWNWKNYKIVLTTGRKESTREVTEEQLKSIGIFWDYLLMGLDAGGKRYLINNMKTDSKEKTAFAINLKENEGLKNVKID